MKNKIFFSALFLVSIVGLAGGQTLTALELISKSKCEEFDCFNDFMISKGFSFGRSQETESFTIYLYSSDKKFTADNNAKVTTPNTSSFIITNDGKENKVDIHTTSKYYYKSIKAKFVTLGFNHHIGTITLEDDTSLSHIVASYTSKSYPSLTLKLHTISRNLSNEKWTEYAVEIVRKL